MYARSFTHNPALRSWVRLAISPLWMSAVLFPAAGRIAWSAGWTFILLVVLVQAQVIFKLQRIAPDLLVERSAIRAGTKPWDKVIVPLIVMVFPMMMWLLAGLDFRRAGGEKLPAAAQVSGFILAAVSARITALAMFANRFFAATVRIQGDRGHSVVSSGPYAIVRHPGYTGMLGFTLATPLALGSPTAFIPAGLCAILLVVRTVLEDRTLRRELEGYAAYAQRVRWRLLPSLW